VRLPNLSYHAVTLTSFQLHVHRVTRIADSKNKVPAIQAFTFIIVTIIVKIRHFAVICPWGIKIFC